MKKNATEVLVRKKHIGTNIALILLSLIWLIPVFFMLLSSMKTKQEYNMSYFWDMPKTFAWPANVEYLLTYSRVFQSMFNSLLYGVVGSGLAVVISALAAFSIAKLHIRHRMFWFMAIYCGTIFPFQMYLIPVFRAYLTTGLYDTRFGLMLFYVAITIPFAMFVFHNHFKTISNEIMESAVIDGASSMRILWSIFLPMSKASIAVVFMTQFSWCYNELMFGMTFVKSASIKPIMATISSFQGNPTAQLVGCLIISIPTIVLYLFLNRNFDTGIVYTTK